MSQETPKKKGHSVSLGNVIKISVVVALVFMLVGGILTVAVIMPALSNLHLFGSNSSNNNNSNNSNNSNNNNSSNNNNNNGNNLMSYSGSGQFNLTIPDNGDFVSGTMNATINCQVQENEGNLNLTLQATGLNGNLSQPVSGSPAVSEGNSYNFNFYSNGSFDNSQFDLNSQGNVWLGANYNFDLNGSFSSNTLTFTLTSEPSSQITILTLQAPISLNGNNNNSNNNSNNSNNDNTNNIVAILVATIP